jgi:phage terminase large subunit GpA-like protein
VIGIVLAFFVKPVGDWFPDPWQEAEERWHDGRQWTGHMRSPNEDAPA